MKKNILLMSVCCLLLFQAGAQRSGKASQADRTQSGETEVCKLLGNAEIKAVQGEQAEEAKASLRHYASLLVSECLFRTSTPSRSVSVQLFVRDPKASSSLTPREYWQKQFGPIESGKKAKEVPASESPETEKESESRPIAGVGEQAWWNGNPVAGALYVLQGDRFLRISVGGVREEQTRIERSKALALAVLKRL
ncbi:MAG TPA: hypothetical protein VFK06_26025 [Candidatus Angelobacter sp.]|nr:hypothetical protein [Candidatus Angelobacter sp.]